jgi:hypothetical protein
VTRRYQRIHQLTQWIEGFGAEHPEVVDNWSALVCPDRETYVSSLTVAGSPTVNGYAVMAPSVEQAIARWAREVMTGDADKQRQ